MTTPDDIITARNILGEGIQWHPGSGLWWTDIEQSLILHRPVGAEEILHFDTPERVGSFALVEGDAARLLCAFETGLGWFDLTDSKIDWVARIEKRASGRRFNDGRVDRQGRFWAGTMIEDSALAAPLSASLYRFDGSELSRCHEQVGISNGLAWSPDGKVMYFADSPARKIFAFDFDVSCGELSRQRIFAETPTGAYPDGATVDADGCLWSAHWGASRLVRYSPAGEIDRVIELPVSQPSCVAFGGEALDQLFVTTARAGLEPEALAFEPLAGDVLIYRLGVTGLVQEQFRPYHARGI